VIQPAAGSIPAVLPGGSERRTAQLSVTQSLRHPWFDPRFRHACPCGLEDGHQPPKLDRRRFESCRGHQGLVTEWLGSRLQSGMRPRRDVGSSPTEASSFPVTRNSVTGNSVTRNQWPVAQRTEQRFPKPRRAGSSPAGPSQDVSRCCLARGAGRRLPVIGSTGSTPVARLPPRCPVSLPHPRLSLHEPA
jgi:hypothetical protein